MTDREKEIYVLGFRDGWDTFYEAVREIDHNGTDNPDDEPDWDFIEERLGENNG